MDQDKETLKILQGIVEQQRREIDKLNMEIKRLYCLLIGENTMMNSIKSGDNENYQ